MVRLFVVAALSQISIYLGNALFTLIAREKTFQGLGVFYTPKLFVGPAVAILFYYAAQDRLIPPRLLIVMTFVIGVLLHLFLTVEADFTATEKIIAVASGFFVGLGEVLVCWVLTRDPAVLTLFLPTGPIWFKIFVYLLHWMSGKDAKGLSLWDLGATVLVVAAMTLLVIGRTRASP